MAVVSPHEGGPAGIFGNGCISADESLVATVLFIRAKLCIALFYFIKLSERIFAA